MFWPFKREENRAIFTYWDGARKRRVDPMVVYRALKADKSFIWEEHPVLAIKGDQRALDICIAAARSAFGLSPLSDSGRKLAGATDADAFAVLLAFDGYCEDLKKNTSSTPTLLPSETKGPQVSVEPATNNRSDSGSMPVE